MSTCTTSLRSYTSLTDSYKDELNVAARAVVQATTVARHAALTLSPSMEEGKLDKSDASPVTVADFGVQAVVAKYLSANFPDIGLCAEESAEGLRQDSRLLDLVTTAVREAEPAAEPQDVCTWIDHGLLRETSQEKRFWTLDPVDGTKGFLRRQQYAICLALIVEGEPAVAAQVCPNLPPGKEYLEKVGVQDKDLAGLSEECPGVLFFAVRGGGTWQCALPAAGSRLGRLMADRHRENVAVQVSLPPFQPSEQSNKRFCESYESRHSSHQDAALVARELGISRPPLRLDSQVKYCILARNEAQVFLRLPGGLTGGDYRENIWDHASGTLLLQEAGGDVCDGHGDRLDFSQGFKLFKNRGIVAATSSELLQRVVDAVSAVRQTQSQSTQAQAQGKL